MPTHTISEVEAQHLVKVLKKSHINLFKLIYAIDQSSADVFKQKNTYFHHQSAKDHKHAGHSGAACCSLFASNMFIPQTEMSPLEQVVASLTKPTYIRTVLPQLLDFAASKFLNIKNNGIKDGLAWDAETEKFLSSKILDQSCQLFFTKKILQETQKNNKLNSQQPMLFATPNTWYAKHPNIPLDFIPGKVMAELMNQGYSVHQNLLQGSIYPPDSIRKHFVFFQKDSRFDSPVSETARRSDSILWLNADFSAKQFPQLYELYRRLTAMPFEINAKTQHSCLLSEDAQVSYFGAQGGVHKKYSDSNFVNDCGKKFSVLYFLDKFKVQLTPIDKQNKEIGEPVVVEARVGETLIFKSRKYLAQINAANGDSYLVRYWVNGPQQADL